MRVMDASTRIDTVIAPVFATLRERFRALHVIDIHTHIGHNDPDGLCLDAAELTAALERIDARAAVFPLREPAGYRSANDAVLAAAARSGGRLSPFCRVDPSAGALAEAARCLALGARGIKLHPYSDRFDLTHPAVEPLIALAAEHRVPVLIHAGDNIPPLGRRAIELCAAHPEARLILAHAGVSDGEPLWDRAAGCPNLFLDLCWWDPAVILAALDHVPPGQLLHASDAPYGTPMAAAVTTLRCCLGAGLDDAQIASVMGGQAGRLLAREDPLDVGPAPARGTERDTPLSGDLSAAVRRVFAARDPRAARVGDLKADEPALAELLSALRSETLDLAETFGALIVAHALALTTDHVNLQESLA